MTEPLENGVDTGLTARIIGYAIEVHRVLGPGLLESAYLACLHHDLVNAGLRVATEVPLPVIYRQVHLSCGYRADLIVEERVIVELKTVERILPVHESQLLTYLRLSGLKTGLLLNFNVPVLKKGIRRVSL